MSFRNGSFLSRRRRRIIVKRPAPLFPMVTETFVRDISIFSEYEFVKTIENRRSWNMFVAWHIMIIIYWRFFLINLIFSTLRDLEFRRREFSIWLCFLEVFTDYNLMLILFLLSGVKLFNYLKYEKLCLLKKCIKN